MSQRMTFRRKLSEGNRGIDTLMLVGACSISTVSFVLFWQRLFASEFWLPRLFLSCLTLPIGLLIGFGVWNMGILLLLAKSGITTYAVDAETYKTILVIKPGADPS